MRSSIFNILAIGAVLAAGARVSVADDPAPTPNDPTAAPSGDLDPADAIFLDHSIVGHETIEIWDERPDKPFDRDTDLRLTGQELLERDAANLADALELIPDLYVRTAGRGGMQVDIRGARKGSTKILIDGVAVDDPYYGNFDLSSIPVTDIVQIRVSASPSSPIDGTGGPGGVIEVHTRDAVGARRLEGRVQGSSRRVGTASVTGRSMLGERFAVRASASGALGMRDFTVAMPSGDLKTLGEDKNDTTGALRLEYRDGDRRVAADVWAEQRSFLVPPGEDGQMAILSVDGEQAARAGIQADDTFGKLELQGHAYVHLLSRASTYYTDAALADVSNTEDLAAMRSGIGLLANRPLRKSMQLIASANLESEGADVTAMNGDVTGGRASTLAGAVGFQYEDGPWKLDTSAGVAVPIGLAGANPWPEAKAALSFHPRKTPVTLRATGARKGRVPTLRERFRLDVGNSALGPEQATFGEIAAEIAPDHRVGLQLAGYVRDTNGMVRFSADRGKLINLDELVIRGVDARIELHPTDLFFGGASWSFIDAYSPTSGTHPLDFLPTNRGTFWVGAHRGARVGGTARVQYVGSQIDRQNELPSYASAEISAYGRVADLTGSIKVGNVLDEQYMIRTGGVYGPGRFVELTLQGVWQ